MQLVIDGTEVLLEYLLFEEGVNGQIVQVRLNSGDVASCPLHITLKHQLPRMFKGVMDNPEPDGDDFTEIRILNASFLEVIDAIRFTGLGVTEVAPTSVQENVETA